MELDHIVVAAATLQDGARWCESTLGVTPGPGGQHPLMSTHNRLLAVGSAEFPRAYLEIIAIDATVPDPPRRRWFGLDEPAMRRSLEHDGPRLVHWAARTRGIDAARDRLVAAGFDPGPPVEAVRGGLRWRITVRDDGALQAGGAAPTLIEWGADSAHPTDSMAPSGVELLALSLPEAVLARLSPLGLPPGVRATAGSDAGAIAAELKTPLGDVTLRTR